MPSVLLVALGWLPAASHDYWMETRVERGGEVAELVVTVRAGDGLQPVAEPVYRPNRTPRFEWIATSGRVDLAPLATPGASPVLRTRARDTPGLLVMDRDPSRIEMPPDKFAAYLAEEGLSGLLEGRGRRPTAERERYTRWMKTLVVPAGYGAAGLHDRVTGQRLEILLLDDPSRHAPGSPVTARVLFEDRPLAGARVTALHRDGAGSPSRVAGRTDDHGVVELALDREGFWLVRLVHMRPCDKCLDAEWESFWGSYGFELRLAAGRR